MLGAAARVHVPDGTSRHRIAGIGAEGADVIEVTGSYDDAVAAASESIVDGEILIQDTAFEGYETIPGWIVEGYSTLLQEIDPALGETGEKWPACVIVQIGVGSLADAVVRHCRGNDDTGMPFLVGVEPDDAACALAAVRQRAIVRLPGPHTSIMAGLNCGMISSVSFPVLRDGMDCFLTVDDDRARDAVRLLAENGITAGETGAAVLAGLVELLQQPHPPGPATAQNRQDLSALVIVTEGATDPESYEHIVGRMPGTFPDTDSPLMRGLL